MTAGYIAMAHVLVYFDWPSYIWSYTVGLCAACTIESTLIRVKNRLRTIVNIACICGKVDTVPLTA